MNAELQAKKWKAVANNLALVLELELGTGISTLASQIRSEGLEGNDMRVRLTLKSSEHKRVRDALPDLHLAGAIDPGIRTSKDGDGPIELSFRLADQLDMGAVLACAGLGDLAQYARKA